MSPDPIARMGPSGERDELRRRTEQTRRDLAETVGALAAKTDVKTRLANRVEHASRRFGVGPRQAVLMLAGGVVLASGAVLFVAVTVVVRRGRAPSPAMVAVRRQRRRR